MRRAWLLVAVLVTDPVAAEPTTGVTVTGRVLVVDANGKTVASPHDVWVYLQEAHPRHHGKPPGAGASYAISQEHKQFSRASLVIPLGATVAFPNRDHIEHNVFSPTEPGFDLGRYNTDKTGKSQTFDEVGEFDIFCDIHKDMASKINVVDAPAAWIAEVGSGGYTLTGVPAGDYKLVAWLPDSTPVRADVAVSGSGAVHVEELHLHPGAAPPAHRRHDNTPYPLYTP